eukprot:5016581-Prymnesium_polylepis.1
MPQDWCIVCGDAASVVRRVPGLRAVRARGPACCGRGPRALCSHRAPSSTATPALPLSAKPLLWDAQWGSGFSISICSRLSACVYGVRVCYATIAHRRFLGTSSYLVWTKADEPGDSERAVTLLSNRNAALGGSA